ncbi:alpha/beta fold hydrolase [Candidatus Haliotispira prima]|uniref:Alpha/beta fold hydrolase n=1 Tax=Candidatus Haliotispira prima TaxID=3034016 RepID=A0ABY8ML83_9SPIO|nr:alpha/beta fold hydrolase [Candidatus Haliotispira prima]
MGKKQRKQKIPVIKQRSKPGRKLRRGLKKTLIILLVILLLLAVGLVSFINWSTHHFETYKPAKMRREFTAAGLPEPIVADFLASPPGSWGKAPNEAEQGSFAQRNYEMRYYLSENLTENQSKPILYLIHGAPGGAVNYMDHSYFLNKALRENFVLLAMDRPGYGKSSPGRAEPEFSRAVQPLIEQLRSIEEEFPGRKVWGLGWSFGGPLLGLIAERVSQDADLLVRGRRILNGAMVISSPADPQQEKFWWFNPLLEYRLLNWMFVSGINVANIEKIAHPAELEKMRGAWAGIRIPTAYLQGTDDRIVFPQNLEFLRRQAEEAGPTSTVYEIEGGRHNIVFTEIDLIQRILREWS